MKRLVDNLAQLNQVLHGIADGITVQDPTGKLVFVNRAAARMMHCASPEEAIAKGGLAIVKGFKFYDEDGHDIAIEQLPGRLAIQGEEEPAMVIGYTDPDHHQQLHWTSIKALPVFDDQGKVILAVNVLQDITRLKETERRLKEANARITKLLEQTMRTTG